MVFYTCAQSLRYIYRASHKKDISWDHKNCHGECDVTCITQQQVKFIRVLSHLCSEIISNTFRCYPRHVVVTLIFRAYRYRGLSINICRRRPLFLDARLNFKTLVVTERPSGAQWLIDPARV